MKRMTGPTQATRIAPRRTPIRVAAIGITVLCSLCLLPGTLRAQEAGKLVPIPIELPKPMFVASHSFAPGLTSYSISRMWPSPVIATPWPTPTTINVPLADAMLLLIAKASVGLKEGDNDRLSLTVKDSDQLSFGWKAQARYGPRKGPLTVTDGETTEKFAQPSKKTSE